jgi:hypothetical protein
MWGTYVSGQRRPRHRPPGQTQRHAALNHMAWKGRTTAAASLAKLWTADAGIGHRREMPDQLHELPAPR